MTTACLAGRNAQARWPGAKPPVCVWPAAAVLPVPSWVVWPCLASPSLSPVARGPPDTPWHHRRRRLCSAPKPTLKVCLHFATRVGGGRLSTCTHSTGPQHVYCHHSSTTLSSPFRNLKNVNIYRRIIVDETQRTACQSCLCMEKLGIYKALCVYMSVCVCLSAHKSRTSSAIVSKFSG